MIQKTHIGIIIGLILLLVNPFTSSWANEKIQIEKAKKIVNEYLQSGLEDENWKDNSPSIADNGIFYYTDDTNIPSYIEFQITCKNEKYCGHIIVNKDIYNAQHSTAHINYNIDAIYYGGTNKGGVNYYTTFKIQQ